MTRVGDEERVEVLDVLEGGHLSRYGDVDDPTFRRKVYTLETRVRGDALRPSRTRHHLRYRLAAPRTVGGRHRRRRRGPRARVHLRGDDRRHRPRLAVPVLVEVDDTLTVDPEDLRRKITSKTRAIVAVHMLGVPCDMDAIGRSPRITASS